MTEVREARFVTANEVALTRASHMIMYRLKHMSSTTTAD